MASTDDEKNVKVTFRSAVSGKAEPGNGRIDGKITTGIPF